MTDSSERKDIEENVLKTRPYSTEPMLPARNEEETKSDPAAVWLPKAVGSDLAGDQTPGAFNAHPPSLFDVDKPFEAAKAKALRMLSFAPLSSWEVCHRLQERHGVPEELSKRVAERLKETVREPIPDREGLV